MQRRTERIWMKDSFILKQLSRASKNLYNYANYIFKKQLEMKHFTSTYELMDIVRYHPTYHALPAHSSQQLIKSLVKSWKSYFRALKAYKKNPSKFLGQPRSPKYKRKNGFHTIFFTSNQVKIKDGFVIFPKRVGLKIETRLVKAIKAARIIPKNEQFLLELIYEVELKELKISTNIAAVDLGVNNLISSVNNVTKPVIIKGRKLKSINQWFNKEKARIQSIYMKQGINNGNVFSKLQNKRYKQMEDYLHKASKLFIDHCVKNSIDTIVIGYNEGWKQQVKIGKVNNQNFVSIPFLNLVNKIRYKAEDNGISVIVTEESYTSKCSFLDNEEVRKHVNYKGNRVSRGLFRSGNGQYLNADLNSAGNIIRKVFPMYSYGVVDAVSHPICLKNR